MHWQGLLAALVACEPPYFAMVDSTAVRAKGAAKPGYRPIAWWPDNKIHALADGAGRLYALMLTAGQVHEFTAAGPCWPACRRCARPPTKRDI
jgi:hypothetical protein